MKEVTKRDVYFYFMFLFLLKHETGSHKRRKGPQQEVKWVCCGRHSRLNPQATIRPQGDIILNNAAGNLYEVLSLYNITKKQQRGLAESHLWGQTVSAATAEQVKAGGVMLTLRTAIFHH